MASFRGFYFLNAFESLPLDYFEKKFSSPIGAFIFLMVSEEEIDAYARMLVFVPYRGFYFLNWYDVSLKTDSDITFSSPIGAFIFLMVHLYLHHVLAISFRPLSGLLFS